MVLDASNEWRTNAQNPTPNTQLMVNILNASGHKIATIDDDGIVRGLMSVKMGRVSFNGDVYDNTGKKVGYFQENGYVYDEETRRVGIVRNDGRVYDYENHYIGKTAGGRIESGGAALLLLVR